MIRVVDLHKRFVSGRARLRRTVTAVAGVDFTAADGHPPPICWATQSEMSECKAILLSDRAVLRVSGEAARNFLQGLITNHIDRAKPGSAIHAGLLTPQGKILVDFFVLPAGDGFLLDLPKAKLAELTQRLTVYKLRTQVAFAEEQLFKVAVSWGSPPHLPEGAVAYADPRLDELSHRILLPANADVSGLGCALGLRRERDGAVYNGQMPAAVSLKDRELADVLTFVRRSWGNSASPISGSQILGVRMKTAGRSRPWNVGEIDSIPEE